MLKIVKIFIILFSFSSISHFLYADNEYSKSVKLNGHLNVKGNSLINQSGEAVQFKGVSSFWLNWHGEFSNASSIKYLKEEGGISIFRAAMGVEEEFGYLENPIDMVPGQIWNTLQ